MITCLADALFPSVGEAAVRVLRELGVTVDFPAGQVCCGQPAFNSGYPDEARAAARAYLRAFAASERVVSVSGSCAAMVRVHYPRLLSRGGRSGGSLRTSHAARSSSRSSSSTSLG